MKRVLRVISVLILGLLLCCPDASIAAAKKKHRKGKQPGIAKAQVKVTAVTLSKKKKASRVSCYRGVPGQTQRLQARGRVNFISFQQVLRRLRKIKAGKKVQARYRQLISLGTPACQAIQNNPNGNGTPVPTPTPAYHSLEPYSGPFGDAEAKILFDRFGFGARPDEVAAAVQAGLINTVVDMTTAVDESYIDVIEQDLRCDGKVAGDPENQTCNTLKPNDLYLPGFRYGLYYRWVHTQKPFFEKLFMFLHDERLAAATTALDGSDSYAVGTYLGLIRQAAHTGDYVQYMRDWNRDVLGHFKWLDGASNKSTGPNENYAREFWELGTVGPSDLNGAPVYSDRDIAQSALAFTGWTMEGYQVQGDWVSYPVYVPAFHAVGPFTIFAGTPYEAAVSNDEEVLQATFRHPRTAESLAEDIWKQFINPDPAPDSIRSLAAIIRNNNYNLIATLRQVMISQAMFAPESRKSLIKHPVDKLIGLLRQTQLPINYDDIDWMLANMDQRPLLPDTVFGWDEKKLAGEAYVLAWRNVVLWIMQRDAKEWLETYNYNFYTYFLSGVHSGDQPSLTLIYQLAQRFNVPFNATQITELQRYLDYDLQHCYDGAQCGGNEYKLVREAFDPDVGSQNWEYKLRGIILLMLMMPEYGLK